MQDLIRGAMGLHILFHADQQAVHGAWLATELARHGPTPSPGTLYPALHRMEEEGLLTSEKIVVEGRMRRVYRTTATGKQELHSGQRILRELTGELLK